MSSMFFIHGMWSTPRAWDHYREFFQALGYRVHTPALVQHFTHNQAEHVAGLTLTDYLEQLERDYEAIGEPAIIVGHSMGGLLAQQLAERVSPKALVLLAPAPAYGQLNTHFSPLRTLLGQLTEPVFWRKGLKPSTEAARYGIFNCLPREEQDKQLARLCYESGEVIKEIALWFTDLKQQAKVNPEVIECPVLTLVGKEDRITPADAVKKLSKRYQRNSHFHMLSRHGHMLNCEPGWEAIAQQIHVWLCWQLGHQSQTNAA